MTVRLMELGDAMGCAVLLKAAHNAAGLPFGFSGAHALALVQRHYEETDLLALVYAVNDRLAGVLLASAQQHPFADVRYASETVWWIDPVARGQGAAAMLAAYEDWALAQGCKFAGMAALASFPRAGLIYRRRGYREAETHFIKMLGN